MRKIWAIIVSALAFGSFLVTGPAGAEHPVACTTATNGEVTITIGGPVAAFAPHCVEVSSGDRIKWTNLDAFGHNPGDDNTGGACWMATDVDGTLMSNRETFTISLTWNSGRGAFDVRAWDHMGNPVSWTDSNGNSITTKPCGTSLHEVQPDGKLFVPYICYQHPGTMTAGILVNI